MLAGSVPANPFSPQEKTNTTMKGPGALLFFQIRPLGTKTFPQQRTVSLG